MNKLIILLLIFFSSCVPLNTVTSLSENNKTTDKFRYYDSKSNVRYYISNDAENLHISLNASERTAISKILKTGLTIYFDVEGKKSTKVSVKYPIKGSQKFSREEMQKQGNQRDNFDLKTVISELPGNVIFTNYDKTEIFSTVVKNSTIKVSIDANSNKEITYNLTIPFNKILEAGLSSLSNLSIGIVSGKFDMSSQQSGGMQGGMRGQGGGQGGGGGGKGQGRGQGGGSRPSNTNMSAMTTPISIWFKADLVNSY